MGIHRRACGLHRAARGRRSGLAGLPAVGLLAVGLLAACSGGPTTSSAPAPTVPAPPTTEPAQPTTGRSSEIELRGAYLFDPIGSAIYGDEVWLVNPFGDMVAVALDSGAVRPLPSPADDAAGLALVDGTPVALTIEPPAEGARLHFLDEDGRAARTVEVEGSFSAGVVGGAGGLVLLFDVGTGVVAVEAATGSAAVVWPLSEAERVSATLGEVWFADAAAAIWFAGGDTSFADAPVFTDPAVTRVADLVHEAEEAYFATGTEVVGLRADGSELGRAGGFVNVVGLALCREHLVATDVDSGEVRVMARADLATVATYTASAPPRTALCHDGGAVIVGEDGSIGQLPPLS